jgi:hypothetical protein
MRIEDPNLPLERSTTQGRPCAFKGCEAYGRQRVELHERAFPETYFACDHHAPGLIALDRCKHEGCLSRAVARGRCAEHPLAATRAPIAPIGPAPKPIGRPTFEERPMRTVRPERTTPAPKRVTPEPKVGPPREQVLVAFPRVDRPAGLPCARAGCPEPTREGSKYCSTQCKNASARARHKARKAPPLPPAPAPVHVEVPMRAVPREPKTSTPLRDRVLQVLRAAPPEGIAFLTLSNRAGTTDISKVNTLLQELVREGLARQSGKPKTRTARWHAASPSAAPSRVEPEAHHPSEDLREQGAASPRPVPHSLADRILAVLATGPADGVRFTDIATRVATNKSTVHNALTSTLRGKVISQQRGPSVYWRLAHQVSSGGPDALTETSSAPADKATAPPVAEDQVMARDCFYGERSLSDSAFPPEDVHCSTCEARCDGPCALPRAAADRVSAPVRSTATATAPEIGNGSNEEKPPVVLFAPSKTTAPSATVTLDNVNDQRVIDAVIASAPDGDSDGDGEIGGGDCDGLEVELLVSVDRALLTPDDLDQVLAGVGLDIDTDIDEATETIRIWKTLADRTEVLAHALDEICRNVNVDLGPFRTYDGQTGKPRHFDAGAVRAATRAVVEQFTAAHEYIARAERARRELTAAPSPAPNPSANAPVAEPHHAVGNDDVPAAGVPPRLRDAVAVAEQLWRAPELQATPAFGLMLGLISRAAAPLTTGATVDDLLAELRDVPLSHLVALAAWHRAQKPHLQEVRNG